MAKYKPAIFQATVRPSWAGILPYISEQEKAGILEALIKFPVTTNIKSAFWEQTIKPDLEGQYEEFKTVCAAKGRASKNYWEKVSAQLSTQNIDIKETETIEAQSSNNLSNTNSPKSTLDEYPTDILKNLDKVKEVVNNNKQDFCELKEYVEKYHKSPGEYLYWLIGKGWLWKMKHESRRSLIDLGYPIATFEEKEKRAYGC